MAGRVDALYIFLLIVCGMMTVLIFVCLAYFAARFRHRPGEFRAEQIEVFHRSRNHLERDSAFLIFTVIFVWGAVVYFKELHSARRCDRSVCRGEGKWMWKVRTRRRRPAGDQ